MDLNSYSASYIMEASVSAIMRPPVECSENISAARVVSLMKENNTRFIVVTNKNGEPLGVVDAAIIGFRLAEGGSPETEIFRKSS